MPLPLLFVCLSAPLHAVDGIVLIDQNRALAGGITPGDTAGFPVTISQPGSYRLAGNLTVPNASTTAISITASHVTLDLNGFSIIGPTTCAGTPVTSCSPVGGGEGVSVQIRIQHVTVTNGSIYGMGGTGIHIPGGLSIIKDVHVESNAGAGIFVVLSNVLNSIASNNGQEGIVANLSTIIGNTAYANHSNGISAICPAVIFGNTAYQNAGGNIAGGVGCAQSTNGAP